jgi:uncharacterized protein (UPF0264 family)
MQWMVSVTDAEEAALAASYGVPLLDLKAPSRGALGMPDWPTITAVATVSRRYQRPLSVSLGDSVQPTKELEDLVQQLVQLEELRYLKAATAGLSLKATHRVLGWLRQHLGCGHCPGLVAVVFADRLGQDEGELQDRLRVAKASGCTGLLVDTQTKLPGRCLLDWLPQNELWRLREACHAQGLFLALAGQLTEDHLEQLAAIDPDVVGFRSAVCASADRTGRLCPLRLGILGEAIHASSVRRT